MRFDSTSRFRNFAMAASVVICVLCAAGAARSQICAAIDPEHPPNTPFRIHAVRIENKLDFLHAISSYLDDVKGKLPLKEKEVYPLPDIINGISEGRDLIEKQLNKVQKEEDPRSRIRVVLGGFDHCNDQTSPPELDVYYRIFLTNYDEYLSHTWELKNKEVEKPGDTAAEQKAHGRLTIQPAAGFNRTRQIFAGGLLKLDVPAGLFESVQVSSDASRNSNVEDLQVTGSRTFELAALNYLNYRLSYKHSEVPGLDNRLRQGKFSLQVFGSSEELGDHRILVRYGASLEGGNQNTDLTPALLSARSIADSGYGGLKTYIGATTKLKRLSFTASYGLQLGTEGASTDLSFTKHIANFFITGQLFKKRPAPGQVFADKPGKVHKSLTVEAMFAAGIIENHGRIPVSERFFGGNAQKNFIEGDEWKIISGPYIRSIPENRLRSSASTASIGGTKFFSLNLTLSREIWGYPVIPKEMAADPDFPDALNASKKSARRILRNIYLRKVPAYAAFAKALPTTTVPSSNVTLIRWLNDLSASMSGLIDGDEIPEGLNDAQRRAIEDRADEVQGLAAQIADALERPDELPGKLQNLIVEQDSLKCFKSDADNECSLLTTLRLKQENLAKILEAAGMSTKAVSTRADLETLRQKQEALVAAMNAIDTTRADDLADLDMKDVEAPLDAFLNDLNVVALSPVGVFDVARLWPNDTGVRYGIGGGIRFSLLNFNATAGYAVNVKRGPGEGRGGFFFSMDFLDIFR